MLNYNEGIRTPIRVIASVILLFYVCSMLSVVTVAIPAAKAEQEPEITESIPIEEELTVVEESTIPIRDLISTPIVFDEITYDVFYDIDLSSAYVEKLNTYTQQLIDAINSDWYTQDAVDVMNVELERLCSIIEEVRSDILKYTTWEQEHYYAAKVFEFFMQNGYSAEVACAIIGNMMIETSGGTLDLKPTVYSYGNGFYGLCQWSLYYRPNVADMSFEAQLDYLHNDMETEFNRYGFCYKRNFDYEAFMAMDDPASAAIAFAKVYERPGSGTYTLRANCAEAAYEYFTGVSK